MPDNRPCQLSRKHYRVFGIIFSHFPSPPRRQTALPFFFRFLKCQTHRFSQSVRPIFPSPSSPPRRQAAFSSFFRFLKCQMHRFSLSAQSVRPIFPSPSSPPRRQAAILVKIDVPPHKRTKISLSHMKSCFFGKKSKKTFLIKLPSTVYTDDFSRTSEFIVSTYTFPARKDMTKFLPGNSFSLIFQDQGCFFKIKQNTELQTMLKK